MAGGGEKGQKMEDPSDPNLPPALPPRNTDEGGTEQVAVVKGRDDKYHCPKCDFASTYKQNILRHMASKTIHPDPNEDVAQKEDELTMDESRGSIDTTMADEELATDSKDETLDAEVVKVQCEECDFSTVHKKNLRRHVQRVHTNKEQTNELKTDVKQEKLVEEEGEYEGKEDSSILTYTCEKCETTSRNKWDMSRHILRVHKEMKYLCDFCDFKSLKTSRLREHNQKNH